MLKQPTQIDVARLAGVSRATVSYVLNKRQGSVSISEETRERVLSAMAELGYEPDARAQSLRSGGTNTIGLLIPDLHNPHFWQVVEGIEKETREAGYSVLLTESGLKEEQEAFYLRALAQKRIDGLILLRSFTPLTSDLIEQLKMLKRPIIEFGTEASAVFDCVSSHYSEGASELMQHLLELGHERIGLVYGVARKEHGLDRLNAYKEALKRSHITLDESLIANCGPTAEDAYQAAKHLLSLDTRPSAIVVVNDLLAIGVMRAASELGMRIPDDLSVAGFDDIPIAKYLTPSLTTVHRDTELQGRTAVKLFLKRLENPELPWQFVQLPTRLIVRESTGSCLPEAASISPKRFTNLDEGG